MPTSRVSNHKDWIVSESSRAVYLAILALASGVNWVYFHFLPLAPQLLSSSKIFFTALLASLVTASSRSASLLFVKYLSPFSQFGHGSSTAVSSTLGSSNPVSSANKYKLASIHYFLVRFIKSFMACTISFHFVEVKMKERSESLEYFEIVELSKKWQASTEVEIRQLMAGGIRRRQALRQRNKDFRTKAIVDNWELSLLGRQVTLLFLYFCIQSKNSVVDKNRIRQT